MTAARDVDGAQLWSRPEWLAEAQSWIGERLAPRGIEQAGAIEQPHVRWWSTVLRVSTTDGDLYFKALSPAHVFEAGLTEALARWALDRGPQLLAVDTERGWMLMRDAGARLREVLRSPADLARWQRVLPLYAELQRDLARHRDELLGLGVPDRRIATLPANFERLLDESELLLSGEEALTTAEHERLRALAPDVARMCEQLAAGGLPETLQHDDLHDGNVFLRDSRYRVLDWGDSCVSHPFHTMVVTLRSVAHRFDLEPGGPELVRLRDAYLEPWTGLADRRSLLDAFEVAYRTGTIARALAWHRYVSAREDGAGGDDAASVPYGLRLFLQGGPIGSWR
jgi:hypothetical protein